MSTITRRVLLVLAFCHLISFAGALKLADIFADHMVLQRDLAVPVWGWDEPATKVTVTFGDQTKETTADEDGKWMVRLDPMPANAVSAELNVAGSESLKLTDILVGDVWLCSGQSNMEWSVKGCLDSRNPDNPVKDEIQAADFPLIRHVAVPRLTSYDMAKDSFGKTLTWKTCTPGTVPGFTAVGFFFGRELHQDLQIPIGLIHSSWGGTPAEAWTPREALTALKEGPGLIQFWKKKAAAWDEEKAMEVFDKKVADWQAKKDAGEKVGHKPRKPVNPIKSPHYPSTLYNAKISPLIPYAIKGAIWYQGESNMQKPNQYEQLLPGLIRDWRAEWGIGDFGFYYEC